jgi:TolB protein
MVVFRSAKERERSDGLDRFVEQRRQTQRSFAERKTTIAMQPGLLRSCVLMTGLLLACGGLGHIARSDEAPTGADLQRVTTDGLFKQRPHWSPDGKHLLFARHQGATIYAYLRNLKTGQEERLTSTPNPDFDAVFAQDSSQILFVFDKQSPGQGDMQIHRLTLADRNSTLVAGPEGLSHEESPCWSPDGKQMAFTSTRDGNQELYVMDVEGGEWQRLTSDPGVDAHPAWSPDGKAIAFATSRWGDLEIALITPDGQSLRRLTHSKGLDEYPAWSPDGRKLAFTSNRDGNLEIYVKSFAAGDSDVAEPVAEAVNVTRDEAIDNFPAWTPDGRLGFVSNRDDAFEIYTMRVK